MPAAWHGCRLPRHLVWVAMRSCAVGAVCLLLVGSTSGLGHTGESADSCLRPTAFQYHLRGSNKYSMRTGCHIGDDPPQASAPLSHSSCTPLHHLLAVQQELPSLHLSNDLLLALRLDSDAARLAVLDAILQLAVVSLLHFPARLGRLRMATNHSRISQGNSKVGGTHRETPGNTGQAYMFTSAVASCCACCGLISHGSGNTSARGPTL